MGRPCAPENLEILGPVLAHQPGMTTENGRTSMSDPLHALPVVGEQTLRALARYPSRTAFSWPGGSMTYRAATDLIGRMQGIFAKLGFAPGTRVALLTANRADAWCVFFFKQKTAYEMRT